MTLVSKHSFCQKSGLVKSTIERRTLTGAAVARIKINDSADWVLGLELLTLQFASDQDIKKDIILN